MSLCFTAHWRVLMDVVLNIFSCSGNICSRIPLSIACSIIWNRAYFATMLFTKKSVIGSMTVEANVSPTAPPSRFPVPSSNGPPITENVANRAASR